VWNAAVRLVFFLLGVSVAALVKRTEVELLREVSRRTRTLRTEAERRRRLEREMIEVSAREQVRLAQDLHDGLGQYLSAMAFHARMLTDDLRQQRSLHTQQAERIVELIRLTNQVTRRLDRALRVPEAGEGGLFAAIRALAGEFEQLTGVRCELETVESPIVLDEFRTLMVFRIVQEAFNNAVKHSNPRVIRVGFLTGDHTMVVRVVHDGEGIPVKPEREPGTGLRIMKLRAELIGAILDIGPVESGGYQVKCVLPLSSRELKVQGGCP
jgi:signal transduction histidine kinase